MIQSAVLSSLMALWLSYAPSSQELQRSSSTKTCEQLSRVEKVNFLAQQLEQAQFEENSPNGCLRYTKQAANTQGDTLYYTILTAPPEKLDLSCTLPHGERMLSIGMQVYGEQQAYDVHVLFPHIRKKPAEMGFYVTMMRGRFPLPQDCETTPEVAPICSAFESQLSDILTRFCQEFEAKKEIKRKI